MSANIMDFISNAFRPATEMRAVTEDSISQKMEDRIAGKVEEQMVEKRAGEHMVEERVNECMKRIPAFST